MLFQSLTDFSNVEICNESSSWDEFQITQKYCLISTKKSPMKNLCNFHGTNCNAFHIQINRLNKML